MADQEDKSWYKIPLTGDQISARWHIDIQSESAPVYRGQQGVALLFDDAPNHAALYFTPLTAQLCRELIRRYGGHPCPEPSLKATPLWGDPSFFPAERAARAPQASTEEPDTD